MSSIVNYALSTLFPNQGHKPQNQPLVGLTRATTAPELLAPLDVYSHVAPKMGSATAPTQPMAIPGHAADDTSGGSPSSMASSKSLVVSAARRYFDDPRFYPH
ncbi:hypothetical protein FRB98_000627 [Tulasnella sp. 332]|nr:hypothetical protein FRB98_000627 [Tulasnella sp. 332]